MATLRSTLRALFRTPVTIAVAIASLALGIGANTAMFSVMRQILWRLLPVREPEQLVFLYHPGPVQGSHSADEADGPSFSYPVYRELARQQTSFTGLAGGRLFGASISYNNQPIRGGFHLVTGNYFEVLGVRSALGRVLTPGDDVNRGGHPVAVLGYDYWSTQLGADPAVLNRTINVNGVALTIVGVAQRGFAHERIGASPELFVPMAMEPSLTNQSSPGPRDEPDELDNRRSYWLTLFGRLKPGVTPAQAQSAINVIYKAQVEEDIKVYSNPSKTFLERVRNKQILLREGQYGRGGFRSQARSPIFLVLGITCIVLLIACANVANLLLARASTRTREIALRLSLGATRWQLIRQLLAESWVLAVISGIAGLGVATATLRFIVANLPPSGGPDIKAVLDPQMLLFTLALAILTGIVFGLYPALHATRPDLSGVMKDQAGQASSSAAANGFRRALTVAQIAASLVLLVTAGLFGKSLLKQLRAELGIRADHLISFAVDPGMNKYTPVQTAAFYERLEHNIAAIPGVSAVSSSSVPAIAGHSWGQNITVAGFTPSNDDDNDSNFSLIGPGYFRAMGTPLAAGREFTEADNKAGQKVAIVNQTFARFYFKNGQPLGRIFSEGTGSDRRPAISIVGVVADARYSSINEPPRRVFYLPWRQREYMPALTFYARTAVDPESITPQLRRASVSIDPNLPIDELKTMQAQIAENLSEERLMTTMVLLFASLATVLAAIGLYGVMAFNVARRTREIGIRMAMGATGGNVRSMVLREAAVMLVIGTLLGIAGALGSAKLAAAALPGISLTPDIPVYALAAALLSLVAVSAACVPALRATRIDPIAALRHE
jgi:predicted permease